MPAPPFNFLGLDKKLSDYKGAKIVVLPIPYERTVSYGEGTAKGPRAIIEASRFIEFYDEEMKCECHEVGIHSAKSLKPGALGANPKPFLKKIKSNVKKYVKDGKFVCALGGEHTITEGIVDAYLEKYPKLSVLQIDAHADMKDEYEGTSYSHACAMRRIFDKCKMVQVGIRSLSKEEAEFSKKRNLNIHYAHTISREKDENWIKRAVNDLTEDVYVTIDVDGLDPSLIPTTGTPEPGGLIWYQALGLLKEVCQRKNVVAFDCVELAPQKGSTSPDFTCARLCYKVMCYKFAQKLA